MVERAIVLSQSLGQPAAAARVISMWRGLEQTPSESVGDLPLPDADRSLLRQLRSQQTKVAQLSRQTKGSDRLTVARQELLLTLNHMRQQNPDFESLVSVGTDDLLALQPQLPAGTTLIQYFPGEKSLYIQAMRREGLVVRELRVSRQRLFELVKEWRKSLEDPTVPPKTAVGEELYRALIEPVAEAVKGQEQILLLPTGELWYLPWESLPAGDGAPFGRDHSLAYLSSGDLRALGQPAVHPAGEVVGLGAPVGADLPASQVEIEKLASLFPGTHALVGEQALLPALKTLAAQARILHFATHSKVDGKDWNASFLRLSDGALRISDIYGWKLPRGALVVLSSCQSGYGQEAPGREVASLARAFHFAGAGAVIASLWPVDDQATAALFAEFYQELARGASPGQALRGARNQLQRSSQWSHPAFWSAFVLQGDPR
jgi:CHAT domain-containing protein